MRKANKSDEAVCSAALDGGGKDEPAVPPTTLSERLKREVDEYEEHLATHQHGSWAQGRLDGLRRVLEIIQANEGS